MNNFVLILMVKIKPIYAKLIQRLFSVRKETNENRVTTPQMMSRKPDGKMKLREKRIMRLNIERRK